jgi:hypothetical protein
MANGYLIACESGADPVPLAHGLVGNGVMCARINTVVDPMILVPPDELLNQDSQNSLLSREDFNVLSAWILAIMITAMGLRLVLKTLNIGEKTNEK